MKKVTLKNKDERTPEEIKKNKARLEHQLIPCDECGEEFMSEELHPLKEIDGTVAYEKLCEKCEDMYTREDEPIATIIYGDEKEEQTKFIKTYTDDTKGEFKAVYHRTDGWRGYYDIIPSDKWVAIHTDCILAYSEDAEELEKFDTEFRKALDHTGIKYARAFSRTSNAFSGNYDFFVEKGKEKQAEAIRVVLALKYRDPERFKATALTGTDPSQFNKKDKQFIQVVKLLDTGLSPEDAVEKIVGVKQ